MNWWIRTNLFGIIFDGYKLYENQAQYHYDQIKKEYPNLQFTLCSYDMGDKHTGDKV